MKKSLREFLNEQLDESMVQEYDVMIRSFIKTLDDIKDEINLLKSDFEFQINSLRDDDTTSWDTYDIDAWESMDRTAQRALKHLE